MWHIVSECLSGRSKTCPKPVTIQPALTCWAMRNVILRRPQSTRTVFCREIEGRVRAQGQSTGDSLWRGQPLGSGVPTGRVRPVWCTLDWAKALKIGTSFSSSTWSAQRSAMLRMWIGSSRMFWQREPRSALLLQPSSAATSPTPLRGGQERCRAHLAILLLVDGGSCLAEE